jgi:hypothetical protein
MAWTYPGACGAIRPAEPASHSFLLPPAEPGSERSASARLPQGVVEGLEDLIEVMVEHGVQALDPPLLGKALVNEVAVSSTTSWVSCLARRSSHLRWAGVQPCRA